MLHSSLRLRGLLLLRIGLLWLVLGWIGERHFICLACGQSAVDGLVVGVSRNAIGIEGKDGPNTMLADIFGYYVFDGLLAPLFLHAVFQFRIPHTLHVMQSQVLRRELQFLLSDCPFP
jgi:hypothetical protein